LAATLGLADALGLSVVGFCDVLEGVVAAVAIVAGSAVAAMATQPATAVTVIHFLWNELNMV
jgi:hypothetical protein